MPDIVLKNVDGVEETYSNVDEVVLKTTDGEDAIYSYGTATTVNADYSQDDETQSDYIKERPFWDKDINLTWDGDTSGGVIVTSGVNTWKLISSDVLTIEQITSFVSKLSIKNRNSGDVQAITLYLDNLDNFTQSDHGYSFSLILDNCLVVAYADNAIINGVTYPKMGIYFSYGYNDINYFYLSSLVGEQVLKLDEKFIPNSITSSIENKVDKEDGKGLSTNDFTDEYKTKVDNLSEGGSVSWNDLEDKPFHDGDAIHLEWDGDTSSYETVVTNNGDTWVLMSEEVVIIDDLLERTTAIAKWTGGNGVSDFTLSMNTTNIVECSDGISWTNSELATNLLVVANKDNAVINDITYPKKGIYFGNITSPYVMYLHSFECNRLKKLDVKFIPDEITSSLENKVDKVDGKGLSTHDFTNEDKAKLDSLSTDANGLPEVTEDDNGKILKVVNSEWQLAEDEVGNGSSEGGVTSWNDLEDKPLTLIDVDVLETTELTFINGGNIYGWSTPQGLDAMFDLVESEEYVVVWDSTVYRCKAISGTVDGITAIAIGNSSILNVGEDTGEPFAIIYNSSNDINLIYSTEASNTHIVRIYQEVEVIDEKLLPPSPSKPVSWNDLEDRPFGEIENDIVKKHDFDFAHDSSYGAYMWSSNPNTIHFEITENAKYYVEWDNQVYECTGVTGAFGDVSVIGIGNFAVLGLGEDTGEPFAIVYIIANAGNAMLTQDTSSSHNVRIYQKEINVIPDEFIPQSVQADWNETDENSLSYIKNKPALSGGSVAVQSDWSESDESSAAFIKNKPFGSEFKNTEIVPLQDIQFVYDGQWTGDLDNILSDPIIGNTYSVEFDGITYTCIAEDFMGMGVVIGNIAKMLGEGDTGEPFIVCISPSMGRFVVTFDDEPTDDTTTLTHSIRLSGEVVTINPLDEKYIESLDWSKVSNKPFGTYSSGYELLKDVQFEIESTETIYATYINSNVSDLLVSGNTYNVILNDASSLMVLDNNCFSHDDFKVDFEFGDETSFVGLQVHNSELITQANSKFTLSIQLCEETVVKIPEKLIPDTIVTKDYVDSLFGAYIDDIASLVGGDA